MSGVILALNAGSSSIKFALFETASAADPMAIGKGQIEGIGTRPQLRATDASGRVVAEQSWDDGEVSRPKMVRHLLDWADAYLGHRPLLAAGHRIVHGGVVFTEPCRITPKVIAELTALTPLAPLHQPLGLALVHAVAEAKPELAQIACFDTAFHHRLRPPISRYAIPRAYEAKGIRRYGFHGLSYEFVAAELGQVSGAVAKRTVVAHLGNGASLCAMRDGLSVDTTMGFSTLDGLVMGTRSGAIDPGILLYLQRTEGLSPDALEHMLYHESGMLGVSELSSDLRTLLASGDARAKDAIELFVFHVVRETAAMAASLAGLEVLVFTGGIGEHAAAIRQMVCQKLGWLGVVLNEAANLAGEALISASQSHVEVRVIATNEEMTIVRHCLQVLSAQAG